MMKKLLVSLLFILLFIWIWFNQSTLAKDVLPIRPNIVVARTVGLYQVGDDVTIYKEPNDDSMILYRVRWTSDEFFPENIGAEKFFTVFFTRKRVSVS